MSMSTWVIAFVPADQKWHNMKKVWDACKAAGIAIPVAVTNYFGSEEPDTNGVEVDEDRLIELGAATEFNDDMQDGFDIHIDKLPKDVKVVRVYNSW
jgi:hypothetical protein